MRVACALALLIAGCEPSAAVDGSVIDADGGLSDPDPEFTSEELASLQTLRYDPTAPIVDPSNRVVSDDAARTFGRRLFFDPSFSGRLLEPDNDGGPATLGMQGEAGKVSCAGCHLPESGFVDTRSPHRQISLATEWTRRRTPTLLEISYASLYNWDGRRDSIWGQTIGVMENHAEFNSSRLFVAEQVFRNHREEYEAIFGALPPLDVATRFPALSPEETGCATRSTAMGVEYDCRGMPGDGADYDAMDTEDQRLVTEVTVNTAKAIAAYVSQLRCGESRFDRWLDGEEDALSRSEQRGAALFAGRAGCVSCHSGSNLTDQRFHNVGMSPATVAVAFTDIDDHGAFVGIGELLVDPLNTRGAFSDGPREVPDAVTVEMEGAFRTPTLRCVAQQPSFMHTAQLRTLEQVVVFFNRGGDGPGQYPGTSELHRLDLDARERADLAAFLASLTGPGPDAALLEAPAPR